MKGVKFEILAGSESVTDAPMRPYSEDSIDFASELSRRLLRLPEIRVWPDVAAFAFWCRRANLERMKSLCPESNERLGRGLCFHIAPGNIPVNFAFTFMFGLLSGCANIVRLPGREFVQVGIILEVFREVLKIYPEVLRRTQFIKYSSSENDVTERFCAVADSRVIWGGDETVRRIRALETKPRCVDICFADRYSICVLDGEAVACADDEKLVRLAEGFYNDTFLMDQNACSSPQLILWLNDSPEARLRFWDAVYSVAEKKYAVQSAMSIDKYSLACEDLIRHPDVLGNFTRRTNLLYLVEVLRLEKNMEDYRGKCGYFYEYALSGLDELCGIVNAKYQTVTYFGIEPEKIRGLVIKNNLRGIDRIVPIGRAMDIGIIWDGFDIVRTLSRIVNLD